MVTSWRVLLATLAATAFAGVNAQFECTLPNHEADCTDFLFGVDDGCRGDAFFGTSTPCCDCRSGLPGVCGVMRCNIDLAYNQLALQCIEAGGSGDTMGNGFCYSGNNIPECMWDLGDCCECDCIDDAVHECGENGFSCLNPSSDCVGDTSNPEPGPTPTTPIDIECIEVASNTSPEGVVGQVSIEKGWQVVSGEYESHRAGWRINEEFSTEGAFVSASFSGEFDLAATLSGSPTTVVEFIIVAQDAAGNQDACNFFLGILPEEDPVPAPVPAPAAAAPVLPWWGTTLEPAEAPTGNDYSWGPFEQPPTAPTAPSPVTTPLTTDAPDSPPSPVAPPVATAEPITPDPAVPPPTPSTVTSPEAPTADDTEKPTPSPVAAGAPPVEAPLRTAAPVGREESEAPAPMTPEDKQDSVGDGDDDDGGHDSNYVEAGTKTTVDVSATGYDDRPGESGDDVGCGEDGCLPALAHDGIGEEDIESRWSCSKSIAPDGGQCEIEFTFGSPQNIMDVEVVFWKGDERTRTLKVSINGEKIGEFESKSGSTVTSLGIEEDDVSTVTLESIGIDKHEWISLLEVRFMVEP